MGCGRLRLRPFILCFNRTGKQGATISETGHGQEEKLTPKRFWNHIRTNGSRSFSQVKAGTHSPSPTGAHTAAHARKQGVFQMGVVSVPSTCAAWTGTSARAAVRRAFFAIFAWTEGTSERSREPSERRRARCASPFRGAAASRGRVVPAGSCIAPASLGGV